MAKEMTCGVGFMRALLLLLNIIFVIVGLALIGLGIYIKVDNNFAAVLNKLTNVSTFEGQSLGFLAFVMIGGGVFTLLISILGCMGTLWTSRCLLYIYAIVLIILMILELVGFSMAFAYKSKLESVYRTSLSTIFTSALQKNDTKVLDAFHELENVMKCCGINGIQDYTNAHTDAPNWCYQHLTGCSSTIIDLLNKNLPIIGASLGCVLLLELVGLIAAFILARALKDDTETVYSSKPGEVLGALASERRRNYRHV